MTDPIEEDFGIEPEGCAVVIGQVGRIRATVFERAVELATFIINAGEEGEQLRPFYYVPEHHIYASEDRAQGIVYSASIEQNQPVLYRSFDGGGYGRYGQPGTESQYRIELMLNEQRLAEFIEHIGNGLFQAVELCVANRAQARLNKMGATYGKMTKALSDWDKTHPKPKRTEEKGGTPR